MISRGDDAFVAATGNPSSAFGTFSPLRRGEGHSIKHSREDPPIECPSPYSGFIAVGRTRPACSCADAVAAHLVVERVARYAEAFGGTLDGAQLVVEYSLDVRTLDLD